jgi:hypothetical protein
MLIKLYERLMVPSFFTLRDQNLMPLKKDKNN